MPPPAPIPPSTPGTPPSPPSLPAEPGRRGAVQKSAPVNILLIAGSVLVALFSALGENRVRLLPLLISLYPANSPEQFLEVRHGEVWRLFTPIFIHYGIVHLGFNMISMQNIGGPMERIHGSRFYFLLAVVFALCGNLGQYLVSGSPFFGGMSGVVYGLVGYLWMRAWADPGYPLRIPPRALVITLVWFVACFTGVLGPIGNAAHTTDLVLGAVWGLLAALRARAG